MLTLQQSVGPPNEIYSSRFHVTHTPEWTYNSKKLYDPQMWWCFLTPRANMMFELRDDINAVSDIDADPFSNLYVGLFICCSCISIKTVIIDLRDPFRRRYSGLTFRCTLSSLQFSKWKPASTYSMEPCHAWASHSFCLRPSKSQSMY